MKICFAQICYDSIGKRDNLGEKPYFIERVFQDFKAYISGPKSLDTASLPLSICHGKGHIKDMIHKLNVRSESNSFDFYRKVYYINIISKKNDSAFQIGFLEIHFTNDNSMNKAYNNFYKKRTKYRLDDVVAAQFRLLKKDHCLLLLFTVSVLNNRIMCFVDSYPEFHCF
jgi:hypothetical protein